MADEPKLSGVEERATYTDPDQFEIYDPKGQRVKVPVAKPAPKKPNIKITYHRE